jgi:hypothetical protein
MSSEAKPPVSDTPTEETRPAIFPFPSRVTKLRQDKVEGAVGTNIAALIIKVMEEDEIRQTNSGKFVQNLRLSDYHSTSIWGDDIGKFKVGDILAMTDVYVRLSKGKGKDGAERSYENLAQKKEGKILVIKDGQMPEEFKEKGYSEKAFATAFARARDWNYPPKEEEASAEAKTDG